MVGYLTDWLIGQGVNESLAGYLGNAGIVLGVIIVAIIVNIIAKQIILTAITMFVKKTRTTWDDILLERKVFVRLSHLAPAVVFYYCAGFFPAYTDMIQRLSMVYMMLSGVLVINAFLDALADIYQTYKVSRDKPVKGYIQVVKIIVFIFIAIIALALMMNRSPWLLLSGFGAMTAVLVLVFKDTILGLVASVQLSMNDMIRIGDWIEMPKYGADGDVIDITLHTVKVQNWDKTITTIPSYALISDSFKNWRGMAESGGRRIKRAVNIDMTSVKICTPEMLYRFEKFQLIRDYIKNKQKEIKEYNIQKNIDSSELINGRNLTNLGTLRAYIEAYLKNNPNIHSDNDMTFLIRQLSPGPTGIPLEIYVFSKDQRWVNYEAIQADIFDHILAVIPMFELRIFQNPTGSDFSRISHI